MDDAGQGARLSSSASSSIVPAHADDDKPPSAAPPPRRRRPSASSPPPEAAAAAPATSTDQRDILAPHCPTPAVPSRSRLGDLNADADPDAKANADGDDDEIDGAADERSSLNTQSSSSSSMSGGGGGASASMQDERTTTTTSMMMTAEPKGSPWRRFGTRFRRPQQQQQQQQQQFDASEDEGSPPPPSQSRQRRRRGTKARATDLADEARSLAGDQTRHKVAVKKTSLPSLPNARGETAASNVALAEADADAPPSAAAGRQRRRRRRERSGSISSSADDDDKEQGSTTDGSTRTDGNVSSGQGEKTRRDKPTTRQQTTAAPRRAAAVNLNDLKRWDEQDLKVFDGFYDAARRKWLRGTLVTAAMLGVISYWRLHPLVTVLVVTVASHFVHESVRKTKGDYAWDIERHKGKQVRAESNDLESVEWLNAALEAIWPSLDPEIFDAGIDLVEDALVEQAPAIVQTARITAAEQGTNPMRMLGLRTITAAEFRSKDPASEEGGEQVSQAEAAVSDGATDAGEPSRFFFVECEFAYRRVPEGRRDTNAHMVVSLRVGLKNLVEVDVPVWCELAGVHGRIWLKVQSTPEPPFIRDVTFTFPELPTVEIVAKPLRSIDVMNLPFVAPFVLKSVNTVIDAFVAPRKYTLDVPRLLFGSEAAMKVYSSGVVCLVVHSATDLPSVDLTSKSDPYFTISFLNSGRLWYASRCVSNELNPNWEECAFHRVSEDQLQDRECLRLEVIDHDRFSADDKIGHLDISLLHLSTKAGKWVTRTDALARSERDPKSYGTVTYSAAYFKVLPDDVEQPKRDSSEPQAAVVAFSIHQAAELEVSGSQSGQSVKESSLPSSYCRVFSNCEKVFQTRTKPFSSSPYYNAGSETFVRNWKHCQLDFAVMDSRNRHHDTLLGVVSLNLAELKQPHLTSWFTISGGQGVGRIRLSVYVKPLDLALPRELSGWDVGRLEISRVEAFVPREDFKGSLTFEIEGGERQMSGEASTKDTDADSNMVWDLEDSPIILPALSRSVTPMTIRLKTSASLGRKKAKGFATLWLSRVPRHEEVVLDLPLTATIAPFVAREPMSLPLPTALSQAGTYEPPPPQLSPKENSLARLRSQSTSSGIEGGWLRLTVRWIPGMSSAHRTLALQGSSDVRQAYRLWLLKQQSGVHKRNILADRPVRRAMEDHLLDADDAPDAAKPANAFSGPAGAATGSWVTHGLRVASAKLKAQGRHRPKRIRAEKEHTSAL